MPTPSEAGTIVVRLSAVPPALRMEVAEKIVVRGRLRGTAAAELYLAAHRPLLDPAITVTREKADLVLAGKLPRGQMPKVWKW